MLQLFQRKFHRKHYIEVDYIFHKYGKDSIAILEERRKDRNISRKSRDHWHKIYLLAKRRRADKEGWRSRRNVFLPPP